MNHLKRFNETDESNNAEIIMRMIRHAIMMDNLELVNSILNNYDDTSSTADLRCILVATKPNKNHPIISENRQRIKNILENRIGKIV